MIKAEKCVFTRNVANLGLGAHYGEGGGALLMINDSKAEIKSCIFENNTTSSNKGRNIYCAKKFNIKIMKSNFVGYDCDDPRNVYFGEINY